MKNKKIFIGIAAVVALIFLVLLSGTVYNFNRPVVTAAMPTRGHLNHREVTSGVVRYAEFAELYADIAAWIYRVYVREGDVVVPGQPLFELDFRTAPQEAQTEIDNLRVQIENAQVQLGEQLETLRIDRVRSQLDLERVNTEIQGLQMQIRNLQTVEPPSPDIRNVQRQINEIRYNEYSSDNFDIRQNQEDILQAERHIEQNQLLFNAGIIPLQELLDSQTNLYTLQRRSELLAQQRVNRLYDLEHQLENLMLQQENRHRDTNNRLQELNLQLTMRENDRSVRSLEAETFAGREETMRREFYGRIADYERRIEEQKRRLAAYESNIIFSQSTGVVTGIFVNQGQHIAANQHIASIGLTANFIVETEIPLSNNFVSAGNNAWLRNASQSIFGVVTQIVPLENSKRVTIAVDSDMVTAGETFTITFEERSSDSFLLVPNSAIGRDSQGYFVNQVERRRGILGDEFYTRRVRVVVGDSDDQNTAIIQGMTIPRPIVTTSERSFDEGQGIRLQNEGDFFEN